VLAFALALSLVLTGCGGSSPKKAAASTPRPSSQPSQGGTTLAALWPLTGLPAPQGTPNHPVLVVKMPNTAEARPQVGLGKADLVTEQLVEGGITRLAVAYYSKVPHLVGPVRSMRASDIGIVKPAHGVLVSSGAAPPTLHRLSQAHVPFFTGGPGYYRDSGRIAPYNLMVHLKDFNKSLKKKPVVPASYLPWGTEKEFVGVQPARTIAAKFSSFRTSTWALRGGKYINTNGYAPANDQFKADTVLVVRVKEGDAGYRDPAGNAVPETVYKGHGQVMVFHKGKLLRGTWSKPNYGSLMKLRTASGELKIPAGRVWIELVPNDNQGGHVSWSK
jgi:hypothetical protein